jgi:hypothetical protein
MEFCFLFRFPPFLSTSWPLYILACCDAYIRPRQRRTPFHLPSISTEEESKGQQRSLQIQECEPVPVQCVCISIGGTSLKLSTSTHYYLPLKAQFLSWDQRCRPAQYTDLLSWDPKRQGRYSARQTQAETSLYRHYLSSLAHHVCPGLFNQLLGADGLFVQHGFELHASPGSDLLGTPPSPASIPTRAARWHVTYRYDRASRLS